MGGTRRTEGSMLAAMGSRQEVLQRLRASQALRATQAFEAPCNSSHKQRQRKQSHEVVFVLRWVCVGVEVCTQAVLVNNSRARMRLKPTAGGAGGAGGMP